MKVITWICALLLIAVGGLGYFGWEMIGASKQSITAGVPAVIGILIAFGAAIAAKNTKMGMHIAVGMASLGLLAGLGRIIPAVIKGTLVWGAASTLLILAMTVVCLVYTIMAFRSFVAARRGKSS